MCTLIVGFGTVAPGSVVIAANRDEDPARASAPPGMLLDQPRVVGGRDLARGGTWLAIRERRALVAMLNGREEGEPDAATAATRRSRGLLALDVAAAGDGGAAQALAFARDAVHDTPFAPFSMLFASPGACWVMAHDGEDSFKISRVAPGWHALTHADLDDAEEPRTVWLRRRLAGFAPRSPEAAARGLFELLRAHGDDAGNPPVCLHEGRMVTVSSSFVLIGRDATRYLHVEGRPCRVAPADRSELLQGAGAAAEAS